MKFSTIGSCLLGDIICYAKNVLKENVINAGQYTNINPLSLCFSYKYNDEEIDGFLLSCIDRDKQKTHCLDIRKTLLDKIKKSDSDYILIDLTEIFSPVKIYQEDQNKIVFTWQEYMKADGQIQAEGKIISALTLSSQDLLNYINTYIEKLINAFGKDKLIIIETKSCYQYFDLDNKWKLTGNICECTEKNKVLDEVYAHIGDKFKIKTITLPNLLINDLTYNSQSEFKLAQIYYKYLWESLLNVISEKSNREIKIQFEKDLEEYIDTKTMPDLVHQLKNYGVDKGKKLVLIGHSKQLEKILKERYNIEFYKKVEYTQTTTETELFNSTEFLQGKSSEFYLVIPHLYREDNAIRAIIDREYVFNLEIMAWIHPHYKIENIYGSYFDIYNNAIYSECRNNIINLWGAGVKIKILNCIIAKTMNIVCRDQSTVFIEKNIKFMGILTINMSMGAELHLKQGSVFDGQIYLLSQVPLGKIIIGQDAWIETGVKIFSGDGHAICDLKYGRDKYYVNKDLSLLEVIIGDHCLIGRGANLINCKVGQGTIIYPISLVTKKIPNNCICAGVPARVIRRDIAWSREINCYDMNDSVFGVPDEYKHLTGIFDV